MATNDPNANPKVMVLTQVQVLIQVKDPNTYSSKMSVEDIRKMAGESALRKIQSLNDSTFELVGAPVVKVVICEDPQ